MLPSSKKSAPLLLLTLSLCSLQGSVFTNLFIVSKYLNLCRASDCLSGASSSAAAEEQPEVVPQENLFKHISISFYGGAFPLSSGLTACFMLPCAEPVCSRVELVYF